MRQSFPPGRNEPGFSLIELLAALLISAILATLGWPLLARQRAATAVTLAANRTLAALQVARQQALATGHSVTVCPTPDGRRCGFGADQWMVFENHPGGLDSRREAGESLLQHWQLPEGIRAWGSRGYAAYQPGVRSAATLTFQFCHWAYPELGQAVVVSQTGRPRVSRSPAGGPPARGCAP